jgi:hypothetical protein
MGLGRFLDRCDRKEKRRPSRSALEQGNSVVEQLTDMVDGQVEILALVEIMPAIGQRAPTESKPFLTSLAFPSAMSNLNENQSACE